MHGELRDPDGPLASLEAALRRFGADEVIVAAHLPEHAHWLETGPFDRRQRELDVPVTRVVVDHERHCVEIGARVSSSPKGESASDRMPLCSAWRDHVRDDGKEVRPWPQAP